MTDIRTSTHLGIKKHSPITADGDKRPVVLTQLDVRQIRRTTQDIENWRRAIKAAEALVPRRQLLYDLYHDVLLDGHLGTVIDKRVLQITNADWVFVDGAGNDVQEMNDWIDTPYFETLLRELILSKVWGYSMIEFDFRAEDGPAIFSIPRKHMRPHMGAVSISENGDDLVSVREGAFRYTVLEAGDEDDLGLLMSVAQYAIYKRGDFGDWAHFAEVFGMPTIDAVWDGVDPTQREQLLKSLKEMGAGGQIVRPAGTELTLLHGSTANPTGELYERLMQACNREMSKRILGQTETTESSEGSGYAQAKEHREVEEDINQADRKFVQRLLNKRVISMFEANGIDLKGGHFRINEGSKNLPKRESFEMAMRMIAQGIPVSDDYFYELTGIDKPDDYDAMKADLVEAMEARREQQQQHYFLSDADDDKRGVWTRIRDFFSAP